MSENELNQRIQNAKNKKLKLGVIGLGYVGLPLSVSFAKAGFSVLAIDVIPKKVDQLNRGESPVKGVHVDEVKELVRKGKLKASTNYEDLKEADVISICVPTPLRKTKDPDVSFILDASYRISEVIKKGALVVLESTTYPGTTHERILPIFIEKGLVLDEDFYLAYSPERIDPGNQTYMVENTPKVVGGISPSSTAFAKAVYSSIINQVVVVSSTQSAEMVKLLENTFRAVNIGMVNEIAIMCEILKIDTWEVIDAAATKPFGFMPFYPGPGLGGHCIPVDPHYLNWKLRTLNYNARFIELAGEINSSMPSRVVDLVNHALNTHKKSVNGSNILILGVAYKKNIDDTRESPALDVMVFLKDRKANLHYHDPFVPRLQLGDLTLENLSENQIQGQAISKFDCVVILTDHTCFDFPSIVNHAQLVVDTRNASKGLKVEEGKLFRL